MSSSKLLKYAIAAGMLAAATLTSSWFGALVWVHSYPEIIKYNGEPTIYNTDGQPITTAKQGQWVLFHADVERQPLRCWGDFVYVLKGEKVNYQFPIVRSFGLTVWVENYHTKNLFQIPAGIPPGRYEWSVVVYPHCDGVDMSPQTYALGTVTDVVAAEK